LVEFIEQETEIPLRYMPEISIEEPDCCSMVYEALTSMVPEPTDRGRGWCYFDHFDINGKRIYTFPGRCISPGTGNIPEQELMVKVYYCTSSGSTLIYNEIDNDEYIIDYMDGRIITSGTCPIPTHVSYYWNYVSLVDEWSAVEAAEPPVVVIDIHGTDKTGYQLGPGKLATRKVDLHIFASNTAERNDIVETLYDGLYLKSCPMYDFPDGTILDYDGTWYGRRENMNKSETLFDRTTVSGILGCYLMFENVTSRHVNLPLLMTRGRTEIVLSDLNAYRSKVSFDMYHYTKY